MSARIIDGREAADQILSRVASDVAFLKATTGMAPGLAVIQVGDDPASSIYVGKKIRASERVGIDSIKYDLPVFAKEREIINLIKHLNCDPYNHGILVQLPLPAHISADNVLNLMHPSKDVDGFHPWNVGMLALGTPSIVPCTPQGCLHLARSVHDDLTGLNVVIIGHSRVVGRPAAQVFLNQKCSVTVLHKDSRDIAEHCRTADILMVAVGKPGLVQPNWIKPGATVIDVGINRSVDNGAIVGDVAFEGACGVAGAITPVPGGVGPMTVAMLMSNTVNGARRQIAQRLEEENVKAA